MEDEPARCLSHRLERELFSRDHIRGRIREMGEEITRDYFGKDLSIVTILQGGAVFMADLIREIPLPLKTGSISVASYEGSQSTGTVTFLQNELPDLAGRHVLILDDILDTGRTLDAIRRRIMEECSPASVKIVVLLSKRIERAEIIEADYVGFEVGNEFVVGYGLDYNGEYRNMPMIGVLKKEYI